MTDLLKLAERCEQATGPDRELDSEIAVAVFGGRVMKPKAYTASLDAAMTLVPEGSENEWSLIGGNSWQAEVEDDLADACTPALALCAAALRARAITQDTTERTNNGEG